MSRSVGWILAVSLLVLGGTPAAAVQRAVHGTLTLDVLDRLFVMEALGAGYADVQPTGAFTLPASMFSHTSSGLFDESTPRDIIPEVVDGVMVDFSNASGAFGPDAIGFGGTMSLPGSFDFFGKVLGADFILPAHLEPVGLGGTISDTYANLVNTHVTGAPWDVGAVTVFDVIVDEIPGQSISRYGIDQRGADGSGHLRLVTPVAIQIESGAAFDVTVPAFGRLDLHFAPEPGTGLLFATGLVALGMRRRGSG